MSSCRSSTRRIGSHPNPQKGGCMAGKTVVRNLGEGDAYWMLGGLYELKAGADETDGKMSVFEFTLPPGAGPPPHTHPGGEAVYVLEGQVKYHIEDDVHDGG